jgi:quinohemoprotein ethanol dehydrogenase
VVKGNVLIGPGGAEYGVRAYVTAYDAETGKQKLRWFTVPGDPSLRYGNESMTMAAKTWEPSAKYRKAGGSTPWDTMAFHANLNLRCIGTGNGNGSPWSRHVRSPKGGDKLFLALIVALNPDTGKCVWRYQKTPGYSWAYSSTQPMVLVDIQLAGKKRKLILHAPNGEEFRRRELGQRLRRQGPAVLAVERRHAHDRRQPGVPGRGRRDQAEVNSGVRAWAAT